MEITLYLEVNKLPWHTQVHKPLSFIHFKIFFIAIDSFILLLLSSYFTNFLSYCYYTVISSSIIAHNNMIMMDNFKNYKFFLLI